MGLMKKLTSAIVASSLVFSMAATAFAAYTPAAGETAGNRMMGLQILKGKYPNDPLALKDEITRAELVTVIVRAFGKEADAALLNGAAAFPDSASHWASGNIAMAKALVEKAGGDAIGMPDGSFNPDGKLTPAQAVAFLMKFLGVKADAAKTWPANYLDKAVELNIITAEDAALIAPMANDNATRGLVFYLFDRAFYNYDLGAGKTFYTKFVDPTAPVVTLNNVEPTTLDSKVTITGKVEGATEVFVGSKSVTVDANGNFSFDYDLPEVKEYAITVTALDLAGNKTEASKTVTRTVGNIATIEASAITVAAGATVDVNAVAKDAKGNAVTAEITGESTVGTFANGKFTAGEKAEAGKLTLKVGEISTTVDVTVTAGALAKVEASAPAVQPGKSVTVVAKDAYGNTVTGATFSQSSADALIDATTGTFIATKAGNYTVKATKDGVTVEGTVGVFGDVNKLVVKAPETMVANNETYVDVTVSVVDKNGNIITNYDKDVTLTNTDVVAKNNPVAAVNGVATFKIKADTYMADSQVDLTFATTYDVEEDDATGKASIDVVAQVATSIEVAAPDYLATNTMDGVDVEVTVLDQAGEAMAEGAWEFTVNVTGAASLENDADTKSDTIALTADNGTIKLYPTEQGDAGSATISVSFTGLTAGSDTLKAVYAQDPKAIKISSKELTATVDNEADLAESENYVKVSVQVVDKNGYPTSADQDLKLKFDGVAKKTMTYFSYDATTWTLIDGADLTFTATGGKATVYLAGFKADTFNVKVEEVNGDLTASSGLDVTLNAGDPAYVGFANPTVNVLEATEAKANLTAQLYDEFGNKVAKAGVKVTFADAAEEQYEGVTLNGKGEDAEVLTDANGAAPVTVAIENWVNGAGIVATADYDDATLGGQLGTDTGVDIYGGVAVRSFNLIPAKVVADVVFDKDGDVTTTEDQTIARTYRAGQDVYGTWNAETEKWEGDATADGVYVRVYVEDNRGKAMDGIDDEAFYGITLESSNDDLDLSANTWTQVEGKAGYYFSDKIDPTKAESLTFTATVEQLGSELAASRALSVKNGVVGNVIVAEATDAATDEATMEFTTNKLNTLTIQASDEWYNLVPAGEVAKTIQITLGGAVNEGDTESATDESYVEFQNTNNKPIESTTIAAGKNSVKVYVITDDANAELTFTAWYDLDGNGVMDAGEELGTYIINAIAE